MMNRNSELKTRGVKMFGIRSEVLKRFGMSISVFAVAVSGFSLTQKYPSMSIEQMTKEADEIIIGEVQTVNTRIVKHGFETDYRIQVQDTLKSGSGTVRSGGDITITLPGGSISNPPLTQYVMGQPSFYETQDVALFLKAPAASKVKKDSRYFDADSTLSNSYKIIGLNQGCFGVVTMKDGAKVITRVNLENYGMTNSPKAVKEVEKAISEKNVKTVSQNVARNSDLASKLRSKDPLEMTGQDSSDLRKEAVAQKADASKAQLGASRGVPVQDLDNFKEQIAQFAGGN